MFIGAAAAAEIIKKHVNFYAICASAISRAQACSHETLGETRTISISYAFLCFASFPKWAGKMEMKCCAKIEDTKKPPFSKKRHPAPT